MKAIKILPLIMLLQSCFPVFKSTPKDRLFLKEINVSPIKLEWFFYSAVSFETPDYITIEKEGEIDTICIANNVADLKLKGNKIVIGFYGNPKKYTEAIKMPTTAMGYEIVTDTSYILKNTTSRKYYKRD
jgi:hypothetical protein